MICKFKWQLDHRADSSLWRSPGCHHAHCHPPVSHCSGRQRGHRLLQYSQLLACPWHQPKPPRECCSSVSISPSRLHCLPPLSTTSAPPEQTERNRGTAAASGTQSPRTAPAPPPDPRPPSDEATEPAAEQTIHPRGDAQA